MHMSHKSALIFLLFLIAFSTQAQSVMTTVATSFEVDPFKADSHSFVVGDTVEIFGYKKKSGRFHYAVQAGDYVATFGYGFYPFVAEQKLLKKLPDALSEDVRQEAERRRAAITKRKRAVRKAAALQGEVRGIIASPYLMDAETGKSIPLKQGDTVHILGYKEEGRDVFYAIRSEAYAGICTASAILGPHIKRSNVFHAGGLDMQYMPTTDDIDIQREVKRNRDIIQRRETEMAQRRHADILQGRERAVLSYSYSSLSSPDYDDCPFKTGDTVSVVGYTQKDDKRFYALYSDKGAGIFYSSKYSDPFKTGINTKGMPAVDDPEVTEVINRQRQRADSLQQALAKAAAERLVATKRNIIETLAKLEPIFITVNSWETDAAGGVSMDISVTNCSPTQTIKYISFQGYFTNPVGDKCYNEIGGGTTWKVRGIGPIGPRPTTLDNIDERIDSFEANYDFDNIHFYSETAQYIHVTTVTIQYMSGRSLTLSGEKLHRHLSYK